MERQRWIGSTRGNTLNRVFCKASLRRWHLSRKMKEVREETMQVFGEDISWQRKPLVQRPRGGNVLGRLKG